MVVTWMISILFINGAYGLQATCSEENPFDVCGFDINDIHVPVNMSDMLDMCRTLKSYYTCFEEHEEKFPSLNLCGYPLIMKKAEPSIRNLCRQGSLLHEGFVRNMDCFNKRVAEWDSFLNWETPYGDKLVILYEKVSDRKLSKHTRDCVKEYLLYHESKTWISNKCGKEAAKVYQDLYLESEYYHLHCTSSEFKKIRHVVTAVVGAILDERIGLDQIMNQ